MIPAAADLRRQAAACEAMGSPFTARLLALLAGDLEGGAFPPGPVAEWLRAWKGTKDEAMPLRLAGALHALVLAAEAPALAAAYPPGDADLAAPLREALALHGDRIRPWLDHPPQTNEVARGAVLIAAAHLLHARHPLPLRLSELGASAGLNLHLDRFALEAGGTRLGPPDAALTLRPRWEGPVPAPAPVRVEERRGADLAPVDAGDPAARLRLRAFVWADQRERLERLDRALALPPAPVDRADAAAWLPSRLARPAPGRLHLVFHTVAWQYFPPATQGACTAAVEAAGARATPDAPLAWLSYEGDGQSPSAVLALRLWPGDRRGDHRLDLGRADFHGRWVEWRA